MQSKAVRLPRSVSHAVQEHSVYSENFSTFCCNILLAK